MMGSDRLADLVGGKLGTRLEAASATMAQLDAHVVELTRTMQQILEELRRRPGNGV